MIDLHEIMTAPLTGFSFPLKTEHSFERVSRIEVLFISPRRIRQKYVPKVRFF
ncbi:hypothetical protein EMIT074MI3_12191 [Bacillus licheniformis]